MEVYFQHSGNAASVVPGLRPAGMCRGGDRREPPPTAGTRQTCPGARAGPGSGQALDGAGGVGHLQAGAQRAPVSAVETAELDFPHSPLKISAAFHTRLGAFRGSIKMHSLFYHENAQKGHGKKKLIPK